MAIPFQIAAGILLPFFGTALGAAAVFLNKAAKTPRAQPILLGFSSGVMLAASIWSLLLPSIELSVPMGTLRFIPAAAGFLMGGGTFLLFDLVAPRLTEKAEKLNVCSRRTFLLIAAVTLHNLPEGIAVGVACAGPASGDFAAGFPGAFALSLGVALQNIPEGAVVSLPLFAEGAPRRRAFAAGTLSGAVEPIGALTALGLSAAASALLPYLLSFAAGAMICVVANEIIPQMHTEETRGSAPALLFGFALMMTLDVALG